MRRLGYAARYVGGELAALVGIVILAVAEGWPRRVPDLRRLIARPDIAATHGAIMAWLDRHLQLIETRAQWLQPCGRGVADSCRTNWQQTASFSPERKRPQVACTRRIWAAYGCDGDLQSLLTALSSTLSAIGWGNVRGGNWDARGGLGPSTSQMRTLSWQPGGELACELPSPGQSVNLRESAEMYVSWADRTDPGHYGVPRTARGADPACGSLLYQPVDVGGRQPDALAAEALLNHESTIVIEVRARYYENANVNAEPDRLHRRLRFVSGL